MEDSKFKKMTEESVQKLICKLAVPTIISMMITSAYNIADSYFVSKINTSTTGAVGVVFSYMALIQALGFLYGQGSGNYISRALGSKRINDAEVMSVSGFVIAFLSGCIIAVMGHFYSYNIVDILGSTTTIRPYAATYLEIVSFGAPFMCSSLVLNNQLRFQGSANYAMIGIGVGGILNIFLDPLFIFEFDMGIAGAALATALSQFISFVLLIVGTNMGSNIRLKFSKLSFNIHTYVEMFINGMPSLARQGLASIATICLNHTAVPYGDAAIAAMSVVSRINMLANSAVIGFGQGFQPVCGFNYGAGLYNRVRKAYWFCVKVSVIFLIVVGAVIFINAEYVMRIFEKDSAMVWEIGANALRYQSLALPLGGFIILTNMLLQTIRKPARATILAAARQGLIFIPCVIILNYIFGLIGIELAQPISDLISFILGVILVIPVNKELKYSKKQ